MCLGQLADTTDRSMYVSAPFFPGKAYLSWLIGYGDYSPSIERASEWVQPFVVRAVGVR